MFTPLQAITDASQIATLKRLNYRGNNVSNINENTVSNPACSGSHHMTLAKQYR